MWRDVQVLGQVLKAVIALHGAGYAHRNIKPSNILQRGTQHDWILSDFAASCPLSVSPMLLHNACFTRIELYPECKYFAIKKNTIPGAAVAAANAVGVSSL